jgi:hypothetical protein
MQPIALQIRRDTDARWTSTGTILRPGEQSYATDTNTLKIGDGINTWSNLPPIGSSSTSPLMTDNFMVAGGQGSLSPGTSLAYSYDGLTWVVSPTTMFDSGLCLGLAWNGSIWLAVGNDGTDGLIASSPDGITWTADLSGGSTPFSGSGVSNTGSVHAAAWNGSLWVAGGSDGFVSVIATSPDGKTWTAQTSPFNNGSNQDSSSCNAVASNGTMFVAGGQSESVYSNDIAYSYDGIRWVIPPTESIFELTTGDVTSIAWNGQFWVAGGGGGDGINTTIATSPDGINWTERTFPVALGSISSVAWNGSLWMACGKNDTTSNGFIVTSPNGTTWTDITANLGGTNPFTNIHTVSWNGTRWFLGGFDANGPVFRTSVDTLTWTSKTTGISAGIYATASRRPLPYIGEPPVGPTTPTLSLSYYLSENTGANTGPNAISVIGFNTPDPSNSVTGGALDMTYNTGNGVLTNTSSKTISVLVSGQVTTDNTAFDLNRIQPCLYVTKNADNIVSSSVLNFNGSSFSTIVVLTPNETISIRYSQTSPYDPVLDVSGVEFLGGQFSTRITFTQLDLAQGPAYVGTDSFSGVVRSSLIPDTSKTYDLGSTGFPFRSLHVTGTTIYVGGAALKEEGGTINSTNSDGSPGGGPTGPTGPSSTIGTAIIYGIGLPDSESVGIVGDTYIRTDTAGFYKKESENTPVWTEKMNIGAVATYSTISSTYWGGGIGPTGIAAAIDRIAFALYTVASNTPIP